MFTALSIALMPASYTNFPIGPMSCDTADRMFADARLAP